MESYFYFLNSNLAVQTINITPDQLLNGWTTTSTYPVKLIKYGRVASVYLGGLTGAGNAICDLNAYLPGLYIYDREGTGVYIDNGKLYLSKNALAQELIFTFAY